MRSSPAEDMFALIGAAHGRPTYAKDYAVRDYHAVTAVLRDATEAPVPLALYCWLVQ